ncbi:ABC1-domain-containing protein [Lactarius psammicola]|nr:ABC1-domain-containing protein [Lactarius psammicola]
MPPGPAFNWLTVAHSALQVLDHALKYRAAQVQLTITRVSQNQQHSREEHENNQRADEPATPAHEPPSPPHAFVQQSSLLHANEAWLGQLQVAATPRPPLYGTVLEAPNPAGTTTASLATGLTPQESNLATTAFSTEAEVEPPPLDPLALEAEPKMPQRHGPLLQGVPAQDVRPATSSNTVHSKVNLLQVFASRPESARHLQSSKVPSSRIGRLFHYGGLAASLGYGAASEFLRRSTTSTSNSTDPLPSLMMTEANLTRLVSKLTRMRGAALKVGQFLSIQDTHVLPPELDRVFRRVQDSAHYMPNWQMESVMTSSLGPAWRSSFANFNPIPFAAASIGQVHQATLAAQVKIQFPNIVESVASDLGYIRLLLTAGRLLPRGLFLDKTLTVMKEELADECNYAREAGCMRSFGSAERLGGDERFKVPWVWEGSTDRVLVMEHVDGISVGEDAVHRLPQADRDEIAARVIELCLKELFTFREMQTDPNWSNFLWNAKTRQVELVDFGATRSYSHAFIDNWLRLLLAAAGQDHEGCLRWSLELGYLTGEENDIMNDAHVESLQLLATPFRNDTPQPFAFGPGSMWAGITADIRERIPVMLNHRLTPPPRETYSLNRKLSGAFLLASRLRATVDCRKLWDGVVGDYKFSTNPS